MKYKICLGIGSTQQLHKHDIPFQNTNLFSVLQWNIRFVWVLSRTQETHKHDISLQNTIFLAFCNGIYDLCGYWVDSKATQTRYSIKKHHFFNVFAMEYTICVGIDSTQHSQKHDIPFQKTIFLAFYYGIYDLCGYWVGLNSHTYTIFHFKTPLF